MNYRNTVEPNTSARDGVGWCLRFTQTVWGAPVRYDSAWEAWEHAPGRHEDYNIPQDAHSILWFEHVGTYGSPPVKKNWGHVVSHIVGRGFLSSPTNSTSAAGQIWLPSIQSVEAIFNAKYVGWSEGINGLIVLEEYNPTPTRKRKKMGAFYRTPDGGILFQSEPNTPFTAIDLPTWAAYAANGNSYSDISSEDMARLLAKYGSR